MVAQPVKRRGRPAIGVIGREITLTAEDWQWLADQPGSASASIRALIAAARLTKSPVSR